MSINLTSHFEKLAPAGAFAPLPNEQLLYHQVRTAEALDRSALVVNSYNTGTGKTRASLLKLFALGHRNHNVLFIAPTNALIRQHVEDIQRFVQHHALPFRVIEVNAEVLRSMGIELSGVTRGGEKLHRLLRNPLEFHRDLGIAPEDHRALPFVVVVNPDIFHYMFFSRYAEHDRRNLFEDVLRTFWYVVIDEFHYYDEKQLVSFLSFLMLWKEWGYFDEGRTVCLLSATPNPQVEAYLTSLLDQRWEHVSPDNESPESDRYERVQTLSQLELFISDAGLDAWLHDHRSELAEWLAAGEDGAVISNSLARINEAHEYLAGLDVCRITGPEPQAQRLAALRHHLLLATPVVDIGYNFDREKPRQNIDFLVCEGRYRDDLVQRIGRAGRVLGKAERNYPSRAVALVSNEAVAALRSYDGQTLTRKQFREALAGIEALPPKHRLDSYIRVHGITEAFYPIYRAGKLMLPSEAEAEVERLYERIRTVFAPHARQTPRGLSAFFRAFEARERWWQRPEHERWQRNQWNERTLVSNVARWMEYEISSPSRQYVVANEQAQHLLPTILADPKKRERLTRFIAAQYFLTRSLFAFRDSFNGPEAALHDPDRLFSSQEHNAYDLLHLIANYQLNLYESREAYQTDCGPPARSAPIYVRLLHRRTPRLLLEFELTNDAPDQSMFEWHYCRCPIALNGIGLVATRLGEGGYEPLPPAIQDAVRADYLTLLIVPSRDEGMLRNVLRGTPLISRPLRVTLADGTEGFYTAVAGSAAWHVEAALQGHLRARWRREPCDAIFA
jgi:CRISPR-associated endonuclease/helicase Cas3